MFFRILKPEYQSIMAAFAFDNAAKHERPGKLDFEISRNQQSTAGFYIDSILDQRLPNGWFELRVRQDKIELV